MYFTLSENISQTISVHYKRGRPVTPIQIKQSRIGHLLQKGRHPLEVSADGALVQVEQQAQHPIAGVDPQPGQHQQQSGAQITPELTPCSTLTDAVGTR